MRRYILRRLLSLIPVLWAMATLIWVVMYVLPGEPERLIVGKTADPAVLDAVRRDLGLDQPYWKQYLLHMGRLARLDLGESFPQGRPVMEILGEAVWPSVVLAASAIGLALLLGVAGGSLAALWPRRGPDRAVLLGSLLGIAVPVFWLGIMLRMILASWWRILPIARYTPGDAPARLLFGLEFLPMPHPAHLVLPCLTLAAFSAGYFARVVRSSLLEVLGEDFIRTARAKGLARSRVLLRHALSHALLPLVTIAGVQLAGLIGGAIATEIIFDWPGLGTVLLTGINMRDMPVVSGTVIFLTLVFVLVNLAVDLCYAWLDPRVRTA